MTPPIKLMVVDDHPMAREGIVTMLKAFDDRFLIVAEARNVEDALALLPSSRPQVVLTDLHFGPGDKANGIDLISLLSEQQPDIPCVVITSERNDVFMLKAHDAGAQAFLSKDAAAAEIARAIESVASGFTHFPSHLKTELDKRERAPKLTPREAELLPYIARGMTSKEIARELTYIDPNRKGINDRTVETHKSNIKREFGLGALITFAIEYCQDHRIDYKNIKNHFRK